MFSQFNPYTMFMFEILDVVAIDIYRSQSLTIYILTHLEQPVATLYLLGAIAR